MEVYRTGRLVVREWTEQPADLARVFDIYSRWEVARWLGARLRAMAEPGEAVDAVRRWRERDAGHGGRYGSWAIEVADVGLVAGTVLLITPPPRPGCCARCPPTTRSTSRWAGTCIPTRGAAATPPRQPKARSGAPSPPA